MGYDGADLIAEYNAGGTLLRRYVHGPGSDDPILWYEGTGTGDKRYMHKDERGSVIAHTNGSGGVIGINAYDDYGIPADTNIGRFQYTGQQYLSDLGLYHYKARIYSPTLGRFLQTDPIGYGDGMNLYAYVSGDPINKIDPTGLAFRYVCVSTLKPGRKGDDDENDWNQSCGHVDDGLDETDKREKAKPERENDPKDREKEGEPKFGPCKPGTVITLGVDIDLALGFGISLDGGIAIDLGSGTIDFYGSKSKWVAGVDADIGIELGEHVSMEALKGRFQQVEAGLGPFDYSRTYSNGKLVGKSAGLSLGLPAGFLVIEGNGDTAGASGKTMCKIEK